MILLSVAIVESPVNGMGDGVPIEKNDSFLTGFVLLHEILAELPLAKIEPVFHSSSENYPFCPRSKFHCISQSNQGEYGQKQCESSIWLPYAK